MAKESREKIAKRRRRRRQRRMKLSAKIAIVCIICVNALAIYAGVNYYKMKHAPDPYGMMQDLRGGGNKGNTYDVTEDVMADAQYWVIDTGDGESIYVKSGKTDILIDTGSEEDGKAVIDAVQKEISGDLDYLIITSPSYRRIGGFGAVCDTLKPANIITCDLGDKRSELVAAAGGRKLQDGKNKTLTLSENSSFTIFKPEVSSKDPYDQSLMTYFKYGDTGFFAESDAGEEEESRVLGRVNECNALVLARGGSDEVNQHIKEVNATMYIISARKDSGVPSQKLLSALPGSLYATFKSGTIKLTTNGKEVTSNLETYASLDEKELFPENDENANAETADDAAGSEDTENAEGSGDDSGDGAADDSESTDDTDG